MLNRLWLLILTLWLVGLTVYAANNRELCRLLFLYVAADENTAADSL